MRFGVLVGDMKGLGCEVEGLGSRVEGGGFRLVTCRVWCLGSRMEVKPTHGQASSQGFLVGQSVWGLGFRILDWPKSLGF